MVPILSLGRIGVSWQHSWRCEDVNYHLIWTPSDTWPMLYVVVILILRKRLKKDSREDFFSIQERQVPYSSNHVFSVNTSGFFCYKVSDALCSNRMTGMGIVWHHYIRLFLSWIRDVMIFQPVVGPDVIIPKPSLRDTAKASFDTQTDHSPMNLLLVNTFITLLRIAFLSKVASLSKVMRCVQQSWKEHLSAFLILCSLG